MRMARTIEGQARFERRGAGTDAERRAAVWLSDELAASGREVWHEPFWCRPNWALAHAWHVALGLAGSLVSVSAPRVGGALVLAALLSLMADEYLGVSPGRRLTPERASQNVVGAPLERDAGKRLRVVLTANYDAGRAGLVYRDRLRAVTAELRTLAGGGRGPGWLGWLAIALVWLLAVAVIRLGGSRGTAVGIAQLIPTIALVVALALLLELSSSEFGPAAGDNGSGVAVAIALAHALDAAPPRHAAIEVVLQGAGDGSAIGLRRYLRRRKRTFSPANVVVLGISPCGAGSPRWWMSDGALVPLPLLKRLKALCVTVATSEPEIRAEPHRGRGTSPAFPGRIRGLPAITIGCLDNRGRAPRSHQGSDSPDAIDSAALDGAVEFGLLLIDAIDAHLRKLPTPASAESLRG